MEKQNKEKEKKGKQEGNEERNLKMAGVAKGGKVDGYSGRSQQVNGYLTGKTGKRSICIYDFYGK